MISIFYSTKLFDQVLIQYCAFVFTYFMLVIFILKHYEVELLGSQFINFVLFLMIELSKVRSQLSMMNFFFQLAKYFRSCI